MFTLLGSGADWFLASGYIIDLYDTVDHSEFELSDIIIYALHYPLFGYFFIRYICLHRLEGKRIVLFIINWSVLSAVIEFLAHLAGIFHYKGWNAVYSFFAYLLVFSFAYLFLKNRMISYRSEINSDWKMNSD
ncbi:MAG: hypothetical protein ABF649_02775 [Bacillus sp. (in: firmicutes)]